MHKTLSTYCSAESSFNIDDDTYIYDEPMQEHSLTISEVLL